MFTGIVQDCREVVEVERTPGLMKIAIDFSPELHDGLEHGASVSVDGTCLTVVETKGNNVYFQAMQETMDLTTIGLLTEGALVNIERSAKASDEIGGHRVSGHVHDNATIIALTKPENNHIVTFKCNPKWMKYIFPKGFIALDGASLTVVQVDKKEGTFTVHLIPETLKWTTFGFKTIADKVNLEIDTQTQVIVDTVERVLQEKNTV